MIRAFPIVLTLIAFALRAGATPISHPVTQPPEIDIEGTPVSSPPDWWNEDEGFWDYAHWSGPIDNPDNPDEFESNYLSGPSQFELSSNNLDVTLTLGNELYQPFHKDVFVLIQGTGTNMEGLPANQMLDACLAGFDEEGQCEVEPDDVQEAFTVFTDGAGNWGLIVSGTIDPQPEVVRLTFAMPAGGVMTEAWAGERCGYRRIHVLVRRYQLGRSHGPLRVPGREATEPAARRHHASRGCDP